MNTVHSENSIEECKYTSPQNIIISNKHDKSTGMPNFPEVPDLEPYEEKVI